MGLTFSVIDLYDQAFGLPKGKPFDPKQFKKSEIAGLKDFDLSGTEPFSAGNGVDPLDLKAVAGAQKGDVYLNMRNTLNYKSPLGLTLFMPIKIGALQLPNEPTIVITGKKTIVETGLVGSTRKGTVKELICIDDYAMTIRGVIINYGSKNIYPEDEVFALHNMYLKNEALAITSALTELLGIQRVVIKELTFLEMVGVQHAQAYELQCVSDEDFDLVIK